MSNSNNNHDVFAAIATRRPTQQTNLLEPSPPPRPERHLPIEQQLARLNGELSYDVVSDASGWDLQLHGQPVPSTPDATDLVLRATRTGDPVRDVKPRLNFLFKGWSVDHYVFAPGLIYAGNRFRCRPIRYPVQYVEDEYIGDLDMPVTISDIIRLNDESGPSSFSINSGDVATPAIGFYAPDRQCGFLAMTAQWEDSTLYGFSFEESESRDQAVLRLELPVEEASSITLRVRIFVFEAPSINAYLARFCEERKSLSGVVTLKHVYPYSAMAVAMENRYQEKNWHTQGKHKFISMNQEQVEERKGTKNEFLSQWQTGWCFSGLSLPYFVGMGTMLSFDRAIATLDFIHDEIQSPSGFYYANYYQGTPKGDFWKSKGENPNTCLIRRQGDMIQALVKTFRLLKTRVGANAVKEHWVDGVTKACDALVQLWRRHGQLGQFIDIAAGKVLVGGSTSGASAVWGLAEAGHDFQNEEYVEVAGEIGAYFDRRFLSQGFTCGGPGEAGQVPDSESIYALLEGYWWLYATTGEDKWLAAACRATDLFSTWCVSYDFVFPSQSFFGRHDLRTTGTVIANSQNRHSAPGICTASGDALLKLFRATGIVRYLDLAQEIAHNLMQFVSRDALIFPKQQPTWVNERVNISAWEGVQHIGDMPFGGTCWCEISCLLTVLDFPGVYVLPDLGEARSFDHVEARITKVDGKTGLYMHNPTAYDAVVSIWKEDAPARQNIFSDIPLQDRQYITLRANENTFVPDEAQDTSPKGAGQATPLRSI